MVDTIWRETRGAGRPAVVYLHGLNGTAALCAGVMATREDAHVDHPDATAAAVAEHIASSG
ncbi:MAG: hypothetical protein EKK42_28550 [Pseudonocardiaceae bacterium]|nr:MAG: hypothetical protein EKK42_28550 [Pseudonocardiaceae bacterium]